MTLAMGHATESTKSDVPDGLSASEESMEQVAHLGPRSSEQPSTNLASERTKDLSQASAPTESDFLPAVKIEHVSTQVHFAPVMSDPVRQIATGVFHAMTDSAHVDSQPQMGETPSFPIKTLLLKLEPENLGTVTLHLRLSGNQLSVRVDVAEPSTLHMLATEHDRLHKSLTTDTCNVERLEIRASAPVADAAPSQRSEESARDGSGFSPRDGASQGQPRARSEQQGRIFSKQGRPDEPLPKESSRRTSVHGLYL